MRLSQSVLLAAVEAGERTTGELSAVLQQSPGLVSRTLLRLEQLGSVRRHEVSGRVVWERVPEPKRRNTA